MFKVQSYLVIPGKKIRSIDEVIKRPNEYFIEIENAVGIKEKVECFDLDYLDGAIFLSYYDDIIFGFQEWDLVDQLWAYLINLVEEYLENSKSEIGFPDQPLNMVMSKVSNDLLTFSLISDEKRVWQLPTRDFFNAILENAELFFSTIKSYFGDYREIYSDELLRIRALKEKI